MRGAGLLLFAAALAALVALVSYTPTTPASTTPMAAPVANLLGPLGATAADLLLQTFGFAASGASGAAAGVGHRAR